MSQPQQPASPRMVLFCALAAVAIGLFLLLQGLGVVPMKGRPGDGGPLWTATVAGLIFMGAGISIGVGALHGVSASGELPKDAGWWMRLFYHAIGVVITFGLAAIASWVAFGPGARHFGGTGMFLLSPGANNLVGRIIFGFGAIVVWLIAIAMTVRAARQLFPRKPSF